MKGIRIARLLSDRRVVVAIGAALALAVGLYAVAGAHRTAGAAVAHFEARVLVDTTSSQLVNVGSTDVMTLPLRASLIADEMASDRNVPVLAHAAGVPRAQLDIVPPSSMAPPSLLSPLVVKTTPAASETSAPYVVSLYTDEATSPTPTPTILIQTQAPAASAANALVHAAINILSSLAAPPGPAKSAFVVRTVTRPHQVTPSTKSHRTVYSMVGAVILFVLWCVGSSLITSVARRVRRVQLA